MKYNFDEVVDRRGTNSEKWDSAAMQKIDDLLPMWVADMDFKSPEFIVNALKKRLEHHVLGYSFREEEYEQVVANWQNKRNGWDVDPQWVTFSPGVVASLSISILAFTDIGDKVVVQTPVYHPFFHIVEDNDRVLLKNTLIPRDGIYTMDFVDLESHFKNGAKVFVLCSPHNPIGRVWNEKELTILVDLCEKHDVLILSDEIHSDLIFNNHKHIPIGLFKKAQERSVTSFSPSKTFNIAGLASSAVIIPNETLRKKYLEKINAIHILDGNMFGNIAITAAYRHGEEWVEQLKSYLWSNIVFVKNYVNEYLPKVKIIEPEASFLIWLDFSAYGLTNSQLQYRLLKHGKIRLNDGSLYRDGGEGFFRLNIGCSLTTVKEGLSRISIAVEGV